jgi:hypothetical protein
MANGVPGGAGMGFRVVRGGRQSRGGGNGNGGERRPYGMQAARTCGRSVVRWIRSESEAKQLEMKSH